MRLAAEGRSGSSPNLRHRRSGGARTPRAPLPVHGLADHRGGGPHRPRRRGALRILRLESGPRGRGGSGDARGWCGAAGRDRRRARSGRLRRRHHPARTRRSRCQVRVGASRSPRRRPRRGARPRGSRAGAARQLFTTPSRSRPGTGRSACARPGRSRRTSSRTPRGAYRAAHPRSACANGGAFGGKRHSPVEADASRLANERGEAVRVLWSREDVVRLGPKRPPVAGGVRPDGSGVLRVGAPTAGGFPPDEWAEHSSTESRGPRRASSSNRLGCPDRPSPSIPVRRCGRKRPRCRSPARHGAICGERQTDVPVEVTGPTGGRAVATCRSDGSIEIVVDAGPAGDDVVLRSFCIGAAHQALGLVRSEGISVDDQGEVRDLTIRSFGILQARAMPRVEVTIDSVGRTCRQRIGRGVRRGRSGPVARRRRATDVADRPFGRRSPLICCLG